MNAALRALQEKHQDKHWKQRPSFVYALEDRGRVGYYGRSVSPQLRLSGHLAESDGSCLSPKCRWLRAVQDAGREPKLRILAVTTYEDSLRLERELVRRGGRRLTNRAVRQRILGNLLTTIGKPGRLSTWTTTQTPSK